MGHFKTNTLRSLCGDPLVNLARGKDHFLFRLDKIIDWQEFTPKLVEAYKGKASRGESPYHPLIPFKMLLLTYLLNTSERAHEQGKPSADPDATVARKGKRLVTKPDGTVEQQELMHLGYKTHVSMDAKTGIVTSIKPTTGNTADNKQMAELIDNDKTVGVTADTYTADKGYDDGELHTKLKSEGRHSALMLRKSRTEKKDGNKAPWLEMLSDPFYQAGVRMRARIERAFGEAKLWHGLGLTRYIKTPRFRIQSYMTFMALNLKRIVWLLTGGRLRAL